jgi:hypothetical protein
METLETLDYPTTEGDEEATSNTRNYFLVTKIRLIKEFSMEHLFNRPVLLNAIKCGTIERITDENFNLTISLFDSLFNMVVVPVRISSRKQEFLFSVKELKKNNLVNLKKLTIRSDSDCEFLLSIVEEREDLNEN